MFAGVLGLVLIPSFAEANVPGGGTGTGANVTVTDNGGTVVLANGIVSITINKSNGDVTNFTYNGTNLLSGGHSGGVFYFDGSGGPTLSNPVYTLTVNPANNGGNQAEIWLQTTASPMDMGVYYDLLRGQQGIYYTMILTHQSSYADYPGAELRTNMYVGSIFDWLNVDPYRFRQMASPNASSVAVAGAPPEVFQWTSGLYSGSTECKYAYSDPLGQLDTWGWTSTSTPYGIWQVLPSHEYYDGGPMHRELTEHIGNTLLNMFGGGHYGFGLTQDQPAGKFASKTFGPAFIYADKYAGSASDPASMRARTLWADAQAQAAAEQGAWPYTWFNPKPPAGTGSAYPQAGGRGTVNGTMAINDPNNPGASPVSLWVGLAPDDGGVDFQQQYLTYQFWVKTGAGGSFTIPNVLPGTYNLWAFGPGAIGTFKKTNVTVAAGQALNLGTVSWAPLRLGPTVWDIGIPDRNSNEFHNGEHDVTPYSGVLPGYAGGAPYNSPTAWGAFLAYANQYPNGVSFTVGSSNWADDWNYCQPTTPNGSGGFTGTASKILFNLPSAPPAGQTARLYIAFASVYSAACILTVNGTVQTAPVMGSTDGQYTSIANSTTGFFPPNHSFDSIIRLGSQGAWGDAYLDFPANQLKAGMNEIDIGMRASGGAGNGNGFEYDYVRLELTGFTSSGSATPTKTSTPVPPTATNTLPPTATSTATRTNTPVPPTSTASTTPTSSATLTASLSPTNTGTASASPTPTFTLSNTSMPTATSTPTGIPTFTQTLTHTPVPPTSTFTAVPPTATHTNTPALPTATNTAVPPTSTLTPTAIPPTSTNTPVPPTATNTPLPPTSTNTPVPSATNTPVPPTSTPTSMPPTNTSTQTPAPPTATPTSIPPTSTNTPMPPTSTSTPMPPTTTPTPIPPTATNTSVPPTNTLTQTPVPPTSTHTPAPPTSTNTLTAIPSSTATRTPIPPTATPTPIPPTATNTPAAATATATSAVGPASFKVQLLSGVVSDNTNSPHPQIQVVNTGTGTLNLNNVTVKYWFNCDCTSQFVQAWVDWAGLMPSGSTVTGNIQVSVPSTTLGGQTNYVLFTFTGNLVLQPGQSIQVQSRFNKSDWSNMTQANDWSFSPFTSYTDWSQVTGYFGGSLVWGQEPVAKPAALTVVSAMSFPNPSTGNGATLSFTLNGTPTGTSASLLDADHPLLLDPNAKITLSIYSLSYRLIWTQTLTGGAYGTTGPHQFYWNEKDVKGTGLANGVYLLRVTVESNGRKSSALTRILILL